MRHLALIILIAAGFGFIAEPATAQTVEELKRELATKNAEIARLKARMQQLEGAPSARPVGQASTPLYTSHRHPADEDVDRALEQIGEPGRTGSRALHL